MKPRRTYRKVRRAEAEEKTRLRIVEALIDLHAGVGPARTTVSAVADRAGVERLTVYRHFSDEAMMFRACSSLYLERNPPPVAGPFDGVEPLAAVRRTLTSVYAWYRSNEAMFTNVLADAERMESLRESTSQLHAYAASIAKQLDALFPRHKTRRRTTLQHALEFSTWRSLSRLTKTDRAAAEVATSWIAR